MHKLLAIISKTAANMDLMQRLPPTLHCVDLADILQHLGHGHLPLPVWVQPPVHHHGSFPHCQLKPALC